jgi:hypothetical protein
MIAADDLVEFKKDLMKSSLQAFNETIRANGTGQILTGAFACGLCLQMVKHNAVPIATLAVCSGCGVYLGVPIYKSVRDFTKAPFKGLNGDWL